MCVCVGVSVRACVRTHVGLPVFSPVQVLWELACIAVSWGWAGEDFCVRVCVCVCVCVKPSHVFLLKSAPGQGQQLQLKQASDTTS